MVAIICSYGRVGNSSELKRRRAIRARLRMERTEGRIENATTPITDIPKIIQIPMTTILLGTRIVTHIGVLLITIGMEIFLFFLEGGFMPNFFNLYDSFDDFYNSFYRGNEVEFLYNDERYYVLPKFDNLKNVVGILVGKKGLEEDSIYTSVDDLYHTAISDLSLGCILEKIVIVWNNC